MYRGFNLKLPENQNLFTDSYANGKKIYEQQEKFVKQFIDNFKNLDGRLDGSKLQANWFPPVQVDIFLSHAHKDKDQTIALSGWLKSQFNIDVFIDSCIWKYADDMLEMIDRAYCMNADKSMYIYSKRNHSTSHVHMMLNVALTQMIDKTECLFFLNTPSSIIPNSLYIEKTESPWIYSELAISKLIRTKTPTQHRISAVKMFSEGGVIEKALKIDHAVDLSHLTLLNKTLLDAWGSKKYIKSSEALDALYKLVPLT